MDKGFCEAINCELDSCDECLAKKYDEYVEAIVVGAMKNLAGMAQGQEERGGVGRNCTLKITLTEE